jgi:hypothetical protein
MLDIDLQKEEKQEQSAGAAWSPLPTAVATIASVPPAHLLQMQAAPGAERKLRLCAEGSRHPRRRGFVACSEACGAGRGDASPRRPERARERRRTQT